MILDGAMILADDVFSSAHPYGVGRKEHTKCLREDSTYMSSLPPSLAVVYLDAHKERRGRKSMISLDNRPITDYLSDTPDGWSSPIGWLARNEPWTVELLTLPEGITTDYERLVAFACDQCVTPQEAEAPLVLQECGFLRVPVFPDWLLMAYYA